MYVCMFGHSHIDVNKHMRCVVAKPTKLDDWPM